MLEIETAERYIECEIGSIGLEPTVWGCGGLRKRIGAYRLPDKQPSAEFSFALPLTELRGGEHALYIRMTQEDGHMAWTSPVYLSTTGG